MKKQWKRITGMVLALALILICVPTMEANAATAITEMPAQTIAMNEFDTITFTVNVPVVAKIFDGIETTPDNQFSLTNFCRIFLSIPVGAVRKPVGTTIAALPFSFNE